MKKIINYLKSLGLFIASILLLTIITTVLQYFNISQGLCNFLKIFSLVISIFIGSFYLGKKSIKKGYLEGLKLSIIILLFLFIINLIFFKDCFQWKNILYYIIIIITSIIGSVIGIQKKKN